jgi:hypothetical protein
MPCYTVVTVTLDDNEINREARRELGLKETGPLTEEEAGRVRIEAGIIKTRREIRRLQPMALITRNGNELTVTVDI